MITTENRVVVIRPAIKHDSHNDRRLDYEGAAREMFAGRVTVVPGASQELWGDRDMTSVEWTVALQPQIQLSADDQIELDGTVCEIVGEPKQVPSPTRRLAHTLVALRRWR